MTASLWKNVCSFDVKWREIMNVFGRQSANAAWNAADCSLVQIFIRWKRRWHHANQKSKKKCKKRRQSKRKLREDGNCNNGAFHLSHRCCFHDWNYTKYEFIVHIVSKQFIHTDCSENFPRDTETFINFYVIFVAIYLCKFASISHTVQHISCEQFICAKLPVKNIRRNPKRSNQQKRLPIRIQFQHIYC